MPRRSGDPERTGRGAPPTSGLIALPRCVILTDLDGTFLNARDYRYDSLIPLIDRLRTRRVPIVFCTSKTRAEVQALRRELGIHDPFVVENGGAVYFEPDSFRFRVPGSTRRRGMVTVTYGAPVRRLRALLDQAEAETGCKIQRFGRMSDVEIRRATQLPASRIPLARKREFDEPFRFTTRSAARQRKYLEWFAARPDLKIVRGNRFHHLTGPSDKGRAVDLLLGLYRRRWRNVRFIGLGDRPNDIPMLQRVDTAAVIPGEDGRADPEVVAAVPNIIRAGRPAPWGWAEAVSLAAGSVLAETEAQS